MRCLRLKDFAKAGDCCHFARSQFTQTRPPPAHTHDFHEVFWVEEGAGYHWINGARRLLEAGAVRFVRADDEHTFSVPPTQAMKIWNLAFSKRAWRDFSKLYLSPKNSFLEMKSVRLREHQLPPLALGELKHAAEELTLGGRGIVALDRFLLNLFHLLFPLQPAAASNPDVPEWISRACREIQKENRFEGGTSALVRLTAHSPEHVARQFRKFLGCTPTDIINEARMAYVATRLTDGNDKILNIALDCGIQNLSHFYRVFRKKFRLTPLEYRRRQRQILSPA
jgi:AraC family cel operon transcriptional repressor